MKPKQFAIMHYVVPLGLTEVGWNSTPQPLEWASEAATAFANPTEAHPYVPAKSLFGLQRRDMVALVLSKPAPYIR